MDRRSPPNYQLTIKDVETEYTIDLESIVYSIGRDYNNSIVLDSDKVSRYHATLLRISLAGSHNYHFRIIDGDLTGKRSKNGIKVNGKRCFSYDLEPGDVINFDDDITAIYKTADSTSVIKATLGSFKEKDPHDTYFVEDPVPTIAVYSQHSQMSNEVRQASIQQSLERLASFPELFSDPIIEIDFKGNITYLNPAATKNLPTIEQEKLNHPLLANIIDVFQDHNSPFFKREVNISDKVFEQSIHLIPDIQLIRIYVSNITKRKKAETLLQQAHQELEQKVKQRTLELNESNQQLQRKIAKIQQVEQQVRLLQTITAAIAEADNFDKAIEITMHKVCQTVDWSYAEAWIPDLEENVLKLSPSWYDNIGSSPEMRYFRTESLKFNFAYNQGKPGRVWASKKAEWTKDVSQQKGEIFLRNEIASAAKLKTALGVPMISNDKVIAVFIFFDCSARVENVPTIRLVTSVVAQLGLIVERKKAEDALRSSMATNKAILDAIPDLILRISREGILVNYKTAKTQNLLVQGQDMGKHIDRVFPKAIALRTMNCIQQAFATGEVQLMECQIEDEKIFSYEIRIALSDVDEVMAIVRDITDRKQAEADIRKTLEQQKHLNELKSRFVTMASHEFRTPLTSILSSAELLEHYRHKWSHEKQHKYLYRIQSSVKHMTELLNDVLLLGKADSGKLQLNPTKFDLFEFCQDLVEEMAATTQTHQIIFNFENSDEANTRCDRNDNANNVAVVCMDEKMLRHIINNLLSNAIKYSPNSDRVIFDLSCQSQQAILRFQDFGIGIPIAEQNQLFESFHRAENVGSIPGTGLGLPIVRRSVDLHGGTITFDSKINVGTTFTVTLPYLIDKCST